ncbi:hypothetical protein [Patulibacter defluvii]|uniref:hypothetical protein n=1 Tax=Patulibacter defluvii TaxID=3095358 RepID=UPI002A763E2C|nr:hypothetical protein [Patulibacter sp. DM4]
MTGPAAYERLAELAEAERDAAAAGDLETAAALLARRTALAATLPAVPPADAADALRRAAEAHAAAATLLDEARTALGLALDHAARGRRTARGYGAGAGAGRRLDRSA